MRDGLTFTMRAGSGVASRSPASWIGAVVGDALHVGGNELVDAGEVVGVFEDDIAEPMERLLVHLRERRAVADLESVLTLEVDDVDGVGHHELVHQVGRPAGVRVELEAKLGVTGEPARDRVKRRWVSQPERVDKSHRARLEPEQLGQRALVLAQRQIQRRGLEGPVAIAARRLPRRRLGPLIERGEMRTEGPHRPFARKRERGARAQQRVLVLGERPDVLAEPVGSATAQAEVGRHAFVAGWLVDRKRLELVPVDPNDSSAICDQRDCGPLFIAPAAAAVAVRS